MGNYLFDLTPQLLHDAVLTMIAVLVLFTVASNLLFNPVRKLLQDRKDKIKAELEQAAKDQEDAANLKAEYESKLKNIDKEAEVILSDTRAKALANESKIVAEAKEEAARIKDRAQTEAQLEKQKAADDVKTEIIEVSAMMAERIAAASISKEEQNKLLDETLKEIGDKTWLS